MDNSTFTMHIAQGIALYAASQNLPGDKVQGSPEDNAWQEWSARFPIFTLAVMKEQSALFDRCLHGTLGK